MSNLSPKAAFDQAAIEQILQKALARQSEGQEFTLSQLQDMAQELGISADNLQAAIQDWQSQRSTEKELEQFQMDRKKKLREQATTYLIVNTFLISLNVVTQGTLSWAIYPALGWGLGLALTTQRTFQTSGKNFDKDLRAWRRKQARKG